MADRKLSIRFSAEGLDEVKTKLRALGDEGAKALKAIEDGAAKAGQKELANLENRLKSTERALDPLAKSAQQLANAQELQNRAVAAGADNLERYAAVVAKAQAAHTSAMQRFGQATGDAIKLQSYQVLNLSRQIQDVGVQLAGGQSPFLILAQQGPQAADAVGGVGNAFRLIAQINPVALFGSIAVAAGAAALAYVEYKRATDAVTESHTAMAEAIKAADEIMETSSEKAAKQAANNLLIAKAKNQELILEEEKNIRALEERQRKIEERRPAGAGMVANELGAVVNPADLRVYRDELAQVNVELAQTRFRLKEANEQAKQFGKVAVIGPDADAQVKAFNDILNATGNVLDKGKSALDEYERAVADLILRHRENRITTEQYNRELENLNNWYSEQISNTKVLADLNEDFRKRIERLTDAEKKRNETLERYIKGLEQDTAATKQGEVERKVAQATREAESKLLDELGRKTRDLTDSEKSRIRTSVEMRDAMEKAADAAKKYADEVKRIVDRTTDRLVDFGADAFFDAMTGKSTNFWKTFEEQGKRALAQLAAEALIRPIVLPIVQSVVGSAPSLFGLAGQGAQAAGGVLGGNNPLMNLFGGLRNIFSPNNFIADMFPSLFGSTTVAGLSMSGAALGVPGSALLGGGTGVAIGGEVAALGAGAPLAGLAPFLPILALALPLLLSGLLGGKKSVGPNGNAIINWERDADGRLTNPGGLAIGGLGADNGGDKEYAKKMAEAATKGFNGIVDRLGGRVTGVPGTGQSGQLELGYFAEGNKHFSVVGGQKEEFGTAEEAVANFIKRALQQGTIEGLSEDVRTAIRKTTATTAEDLGKDLDFAYGFRRQVDLAAAGPGTRAAQLLGFQYGAQDIAQQQRLSNRDFVNDARRLFGDDSTQYADAKSTVLKRTLNALGLGPDATGDNAPLEGRAAAIAASTEQIKAYRDTLIDAGLTAAEADTKIAEATAKAEEKINKAFDWLDDLEDFQKSAGALSVDIARWAYEANQGAQEVAEAEQTAADAKQDYIDALGREIDVQQEAADAWGKLAESLKKGRLGLLLDANLSPLSPADRLAEANRQFNDVYGRAQGGDLKAGEQLYDIGHALLEAERAYSASSPAYVTTFNRVQTALQNTESLAERQARIANDQLVILRGQLSELQTQGGHIKTVAEAAQAYKDAQGAATTANQNRPSPGAIGEQQFQAFRTLASDFQGLYNRATTDAQRSQVYQSAAAQRDALINAITDIPTLQRIGQTYYQGDVSDSGAVALRARLYSLGTVPAFAEGGIVDRPTLSWIAEAGGSEAVVPLSRGRSIPVEMRQPANDAGGSGLVQEIRALRQAMADVSTLLARNGSAQQGTLDALRADFARLANKLVELEARQSPNRLGRKTG